MYQGLKNRRCAAGSRAVPRSKELERLATESRFEAVNVTDVRSAHEMSGSRTHGYWYSNDGSRPT
jgi:hypothetical protein